MRTDNDPCFTDNHYGPARNTLALQEYLDSLPMSETNKFTHSPPGYQALNPVECAVRQLYYLMNFYLEQGHLSALCWYDMAEAAAYVMNRLPHPQSKDPRRQVSSAYEIMTNKRPDIPDLSWSWWTHSKPRPALVAPRERNVITSAHVAPDTSYALLRLVCG